MVSKVNRFKIPLYVLLIACSSENVFASGFQVFNGLNYQNPAELPLLVKNTQIQIGDDYVFPDFQFKGTTTVPPPTLPPPFTQKAVVTQGTSNSTQGFNLPYGRVAKRIYENFIIGLDVTEPFATNVVYSHSSPVRYAGTQFTVKSLDISPNIAYQFKGKLSNLSIGAGFDALTLSAVADQNVPSLPVLIRRPPLPPIVIPFGAGNDIEFNNNASGWSYGWHAGILYRVLKGTLVGLSYNSGFNAKLEGKSTFSGYPSEDVTTTLPLPPSTHLKITQFLSDKWWTSFVVHYSQWDRLKTVTLNNTAGPVSSASSDFSWRNTWRFGLQSFYIPHPKFILGGSIATDEAPAYGVHRGPLTPSGDAVNVSLSLEYKITEAIGIIGTYAHVFVEDTTIDKVSYNGTVAQGKANVSANLVGLRLKVDF